AFDSRREHGGRTAGRGAGIARCPRCRRRPTALQADRGRSSAAASNPRWASRAEDLRLLPDRLGGDAATRDDPDLQPDGDSPAGAGAEGLPRDAAPRVGAPLRLHRLATRSLTPHVGLLQPDSRPGRDARGRLRNASQARGAGRGTERRRRHQRPRPSAPRWGPATEMDPGPGAGAVRPAEDVIALTLQYGGRFSVRANQRTEAPDSFDA